MNALKFLPTSRLTSFMLSRTFEAEQSRECRESDQQLVNELALACHPSQLMEDIGYSCCQTGTNLKELLRKFPETSETDIARILAMMARTYAGLDADDVPSASASATDNKGWNTDVFVDTLKELVRAIPLPPTNKSLIQHIRSTRQNS